MSELPSDPLWRLAEDCLRLCQARGLALKTVNSAYAYPLRSVLLPWTARAGHDRLESVAPRALEALGMVDEVPQARLRLICAGPVLPGRSDQVPEFDAALQHVCRHASLLVEDG